MHYFIIRYRIKDFNNKRSGFTLIELVVVLAILSMSFIGISKFIKSSKWYENEVNTDYCSNAIMMFINEVKQYCLAEQCSGIILISADKSKLKFTNIKNSDVMDFSFPDSFKLNYVNINDKRISGNIIVFNTSISTDMCDIFYKDSLGEDHKIRFSLGVQNVDIKY